MKISNLVKTLFVVGFFGTLTMVVTSCSKTKGCTDKNAETYNAEAEESDPTLCVYSRDKFVGNYKGSLICPGALKGSINNPTYDYSISEAAGGAFDDVTVDLTVFGAPTKLAAKVVGSTLNIDQTIKNVPFTGPTGVAQVNVIAKGAATLAADKKTLAGNVDITIVLAANGATLAADKCPITGVKQ